MHYIVGTSIIINETVQEQSQITNITDIRGPKRVRNTSPFTTGVEYQLYNIKPTKDLFEYMFYSESTQDTVVLPFGSPTAADHYIAQLKGERLPDYDNLNHRRSN